jgi:hypothetical protein
MQRNVGLNESWARIVLGTVLLILTLTDIIPLWGLLGFIIVATGIFNYCPLYSLIRKSTR